MVSLRSSSDGACQMLTRFSALCPPIDGETPPLHTPITLPCGHTLSASHIHVPVPPPLHITSSLPHEIYAAQQRHHQQRLNLWSGVMCPVPTCKRYSPLAATALVRSDLTMDDGSDNPPAASSSDGSHAGGSSGETLPSGVLYYPPQTALPAYSAEPPSPVQPASETAHGLLDVTIDKILHLITRAALEMSDDNYGLEHRSHDPDFSDTDDSEDEADDHEDILTSPRPILHSSLSRDMSAMGRTSRASSRPSHKRRRNRPPRTQSGTPDEWPFLKELHSVIECDVCTMMLYDPVTTPCQHSFCSKCLSRSLDHSLRCPVCRQDLPSFAFFQDHAVNRVLLAVIKTCFAGEYEERTSAIEREERDSLLDTPIFVCTLAFPGMPTILHVFEPRYRLMIRRCIESSSPRFGMVLPSRGTGAPGTNGVMEYGTMLEIQSVQMLPDGRSMVETVGSYRFKLLEKGNLDGYTVGRIAR